MKKITIITNNDPTWNLPLLHEAIYCLKRLQYNIDLVIVPDMIDKKENTCGLIFWYFKAFGLPCLILLSVFALLRRIFFTVRTGIFTIEGLGRSWGCNVHKIRKNIEDGLAKILKESSPDILISHTTYRLPQKIYSKYPVIEHQGTLFQGHNTTMGFIHDTLARENTACGFFYTDTNGLHTLCKRYHKAESMTGHYIWVFRQFSGMLPIALRKLEINRIHTENAILPPVQIKIDEIREYRRQGFKVIGLSDLIQPL